MLTDPREIEIIRSARQSNVRDPGRSREHFLSIFRDFLGKEHLSGKRVLDLGPGQYDFHEVAKLSGTITVGIDNDPAVIELGHHKRVQVVEEDLKRMSPALFEDRFDGLFCKYSINAFWFGTDTDQQRRYIAMLGSLLAEGGWGWIAPWNGVPKKIEMSAAQIAAALRVQAESFATLGFRAYELTEKQTLLYGVHGNTANRALFIRNLKTPSGLVERAS